MIDSWKLCKYKQAQLITRIICSVVWIFLIYAAAYLLRRHCKRSRRSTQGSTDPIGGEEVTIELNSGTVLSQQRLVGVVPSEDETVAEDDTFIFITPADKQRFKEAGLLANAKAVSKQEIPTQCRTTAYNRKLSVLPPQQTRVSLSYRNEPASVYINANFIKGHTKNPNHYICTQGPMKNTMDSMWRMVYEHGVKTIVMVTQLTERGKEKCRQYWPTVGKTATYGNVEVYLTEKIDKGSYSTMTMEIKSEGTKRTIKHFWFQEWLEGTTPGDFHEDIASLISMIRLVREWQQHDAKSLEAPPIVVHSSLGIGRAGAYIALDYAMEELIATEKVDVLKIISDLRDDRNQLVASFEQYEFIVAALKYYATEVKGHKVLSKPSAVNLTLQQSGESADTIGNADDIVLDTPVQYATAKKKKNSESSKKKSKNESNKKKKQSGSSKKFYSRRATLFKDADSKESKVSQKTTMRRTKKATEFTDSVFAGSNAPAEDSDEGGMHAYADVDDPDGLDGDMEASVPTGDHARGNSIPEGLQEHDNAEVNDAAKTFTVHVEDVYDDADIEEELYVEEDEPFGAEMPLPVPPRPRNEEETCEDFGTDYHGDPEAFGGDFDEEAEYAEMIH